MRLTDYLRPERALALLARLFAVAFVSICIASLALSSLARVRLSPVETLEIFVGLVLVSLAAHLIRERRKSERPAPRSTRGAERTPLLPRVEEEDE